MQIGGLGFIQSFSSSNQMEQVGGGGSFAKLLSTMGQTLISNDTLTTNEEGQASSEKVLSELMSFLQMSDLTQLNIVPQGNESVSDHQEIVQLIQKVLKLEATEMKSSILSFLKSINLERGSVDIDQEIVKLIDELPEMESDEAFMAFVQVLPLIPMDQIMLKNDEKLSVLVKSLKLFDLLSSDRGSAFFSLKQFLNTIHEKLEKETKFDSTFNRNEILTKIFTPVVKELQSNKSSNQPHQVVNIMSEKSITNTMIHGDGISLQQLSKPEQLLILNSHTGKQVSMEGLIKQFEALLSKSQFFQTGGNQKLFIKLYPEHLGALRVELIQQETGIVAKLLTSTTTAKEILETQLQSLKQAFNSQNIQIERIEISNGLNNPERFINRDSQQQEQKREQQQEEQKQETDQLFSATLEETLLNFEV